MPENHKTQVGEVRIVALSRISPGRSSTREPPWTLSDTEREQALADVEAVDGRYSIDGHRLRNALEATAPPAPDAEDASEEPDAQAAATLIPELKEVAVMAKTTRRRLTDDERARRRAQDRERLEQAARELLSSGGWRRWSKFVPATDWRATRWETSCSSLCRLPTHGSSRAFTRGRTSGVG